MKIDIHLARTGQMVAVISGRSDRLPKHLGPYRFMQTSSLDDAWTLETTGLFNILDGLERGGYYLFPNGSRIPAPKG